MLTLHCFVRTAPPLHLFAEDDVHSLWLCPDTPYRRPQGASSVVRKVLGESFHNPSLGRFWDNSPTCLLVRLRERLSRDSYQRLHLHVDASPAGETWAREVMQEFNHQIPVELHDDRSLMFPTISYSVFFKDFFEQALENMPTNSLTVSESNRPVWGALPEWAHTIVQHHVWDQAKLFRKFKLVLPLYEHGRHHLSKPVTSRISHLLALGLMLPQQALSSMRDFSVTPSGLAWQRQLIWREYAYAAWRNYPELPYRGKNSGQILNQSWNHDALVRWCRGMTGEPLVDAAMRTLWHTGYMQNRARMIVASYLVKSLGLPWQLGERWFWHTLLDADEANNAFGWQWSAGEGWDSRPERHAMSMKEQSRRWDRDGSYVQAGLSLSPVDTRFVPEPRQWMKDF